MMLIVSTPIFVCSMDQKIREIVLRNSIQHAIDSLDELSKEAQQLRKKIEQRKQEKREEFQLQQMKDIDRGWAQWCAKL
jgi:hypothetical protein